MEQDQKEKEALTVVIFSLDNEQFGIDVKDVREVLEYRDIAPLLKTPDFIEGVINLRGHIIGIIDFRKYFEFGSSAFPENRRIIIVRIKNIIAGIVVDSVSDVLNLSGSVVEQTPDIVSSRINNSFISKVARKDDKMIFILDLHAVLSEKEIMHLINLRRKEDV